MLFVAIGVAVISSGRGPLAVLVVYAATNLVSAVLVGLRTITLPGGRGSPRGADVRSGGTSHGVELDPADLGPRVSALLLVLMSTTDSVGTFTIAQKVPEALGIFGMAILLPVMPAVRARRCPGPGRPRS